MSSFRQIEANRRNARLSTGPVTKEGKNTSRQNAVRHGLTAETVVDALEDAEDYAAFEMAVTADYDAQSAVERELVLRLASVLWRLRRATAIETGLFRLQASQLLQFRQRRHAQRERQNIIDSMCRSAVAIEGDAPHHEEPATNLASGSPDWPADQSDGLTRAFVRLNNLPTYPLDRLSRYEAALWRQACQIYSVSTAANRGKDEGCVESSRSARAIVPDTIGTLRRTHHTSCPFLISPIPRRTS
jgi:hypothetical protein